MFNLSIAFGNGGIWMFLFKDKTRLESTLHKLHDAQAMLSDLEFEDDYGSKAKIKTQSIMGILVEDMDRIGDGHIARAIHSAKTNVRAQSQARSDPMLKTVVGPGGLPVQSPLMNGRM